MATRQEGRGNIALLIDSDNASAAHFDSVMTVLAELGTVNIRRAYGNWSKATLKAWAALSITQAIEPQQQFDLTKGKNATDMKMTIDAMDLLFRGKVEAFGIMSSDSDFMPLAMRIRQEGIPVYGFGTSRAPEPCGWVPARRSVRKLGDIGERSSTALSISTSSGLSAK